MTVENYAASASILATAGRDGQRTEGLSGTENIHHSVQVQMCEGLGSLWSCSERERVKSFDTANFRHAVVKCLLLDRARSFLTGPSLSKEMDCLALDGVSVLERVYPDLFSACRPRPSFDTRWLPMWSLGDCSPTPNVFCRSSFSSFPVLHANNLSFSRYVWLLSYSYGCVSLYQEVNLERLLGIQN